MRYNQFLLLTLLIFSTGFVVNSTAHEYYKIKLRIQIVDGIDLDDDTIKSNIEDVNAIFEQCNIRFNVIVTVRNVNGNASTLEARMDLRDKMMDGLKEHPFNNSGAGVTVTGPLNDDPNKHGETGVGDPSSVIVTGEEDGETWAHELAHALGLSHNGTDTDGNGAEDKWDPDLDGTPNTSNDFNNLLWPSRDTRQGNLLSSKQCDILNENAKKIGISVLNDEQTKTSLDGDSYIEKTYDYAFDDKDEPGLGRDLFYASLFSVEPFDTLVVEWGTDVIPGNEIVDMNYIFAMNADNNVSTGIIFGNTNGIDLVFDVWLEGGTLVSSNKWPTVYNYLTDGGGDISAQIEFGNKTLDASSYNVSNAIVGVPISTFFSLTFDRALFGSLDPIIPSVLMVSSGGQDDFVNVTFHTQPVEVSRISSSKLVTWVGDSIQLTGSKFVSNSYAEIYLDDEQILYIGTDNNGEFNIILTIPNLENGVYYLEAIDTDGNVGFLIIDIVDNPNPTSGTSFGSETPESDRSDSPLSSRNDVISFKFTFWVLPMVIFNYSRKNRTRVW